MPPADLVLLDTAALYALVSVNDEFHARAADTFEALVDSEQRMAVTSYVVSESTALVHHRLGFKTTKLLWDSIAFVAKTIWVEETIHTAAWREFIDAEGRGPSFVDWTTIMTARRVSARVFTYDADFDRYVGTVG